MSILDERLNCPISTAELQRRWTAVRHSMERAGLDVLVMQNTNDFLGGYVKWFTDLPATTGYPVTVIFPRDGAMTFISQGQFGLDRAISPDGEMQYRGVGRIMGAPGYASARFTARYDAEAASQALEKYSSATIGLVGSTHTAIMMDHLRRGPLSTATIVDASDLVDVIKAVKSDEEIALIRRTAAMQDACMAAVAKAIKPGLRDIEVGMIAEQEGRKHGSEQGIFLCASGPMGTAAVYGIRHFQNRVIQPGDYVNVLIENNGPGGFYTELGRTFVMGRASSEMKDDFEFVCRAQRFTVDLLGQGSSARAMWDGYNTYMREHKKPEEARLHCHSQGYDLVERPLVRFDETMAIGPNMNFACHPTTVSARNFSSCCDNFLVRATGTERLHAFPQALVEIT